MSFTPEHIRIHRFEPVTRAEGPGVRACLWVQGCSMRCSGCFVPGTWSTEGGRLVPVNTLASQILSGPKIEGITYLGGEPFDQASPLVALSRVLKPAGLSIVTFTGFTIEHLRSGNRRDWKELLSLTDLLIDGPFCRDQLDRGRPWVGSTNQDCHFLSARYQHLADRLSTVPDRLEIRIGYDGALAINGWADGETLRHLLKGPDA